MVRMEQRKLQTTVIFFNLLNLKGGFIAPFFLGGKMEITYDDFKKVKIKLGTVLSVEKNEKARKPSLVLKVDFGKEIGIKQSSAQITHYYSKENLVGKQVIGVCNFPKKNIAGIISEVLILGAIEKDGKVVLVHPSQKTENGLDIA